jgi:uncharacterized protein (TIGR00725 family)
MIAEWHRDGDRRPVIGVMGGKVDCPELTGALGTLIAARGWNLLTGGGEGVMNAVASAFRNGPPKGGVSIGIIRSAEDSTTARTYKAHTDPNKYIDVAIFTHLPHSNRLATSRNHINVLSSHVVVGLPGSKGTESEIQLAMEYQIPLVLLLGEHRVNKKTAQELVTGYSKAPVTIATVETLEAAIDAYLR